MDDGEIILLACLGVAIAGVLAFALATSASQSQFPGLPVAGSQGGAVISVDQDTLARTIYGEARGAGIEAMEGVASVVMNRVKAGTFPGGTSIAAVCRAPRQFSCWNVGDPNLPVLLKVTASDSVFAECLTIAGEAIAGTLQDPTDGATFYHDGSIATPSTWGQVQRTASIGGLQFYG